MFIFNLVNIDIKWNICQKISQAVGKGQAPLIVEQFHNGRCPLQNGLNETLRRIKEMYIWQGLNVETDIWNCQFCEKLKRQNADCSLAVTETRRSVKSLFETVLWPFETSLQKSF